MQKVTAHLIISKDYGTAISASQWIGELKEHCDDYNSDHHGDDWRTKDEERTVVTVEFEVPKDIFKRQPILSVIGKLKTVEQ